MVKNSNIKKFNYNNRRNKWCNNSKKEGNYINQIAFFEIDSHLSEKQISQNH